MADLRVGICGAELKNPIIPASGVYGYGLDYTDLYDPGILGAIVIKGTTGEARFGNPAPRVAECAAGMINAIGLQNPGVDEVVGRELPRLREAYKGVIIANAGGFSPEEYKRVCRRFDESGLVDIIEVNISCPNLHAGGVNFASDPESAAEVTRAVKSAVKNVPVFVKLSPNVGDIADVARACESAGADGISLINTLLGMRIDITRRKPVVANTVGGFSGRAVFPVALRMVYEVARAVRVPVMGIGGIASARDAVEMLMAGASAVQIGAENLRNPMVCKQIIDELPGLLDELNFKSVREVTTWLER